MSWRARSGARRSAWARVSSPLTRRESRSTSSMALSELVLHRGAHLVLEVLDPQAKGGERAAELMGRVGHELLLRADQQIEAGDHVVEGARQLAHLGGALRGVGPHGEVAGPGTPRGVAQVGERPAHPERQPAARHGDRGEHDQGHARRAPASSGDLAVDARGGHAGPHRAVHDAPGGDRHRDVEEVRAQGLRAAGARGHRPLRAEAISGRVEKSRVEPAGRSESASRRAARADHDHPRAGGRRVAVDHAAQRRIAGRRCPAGCPRPGRRGRPRPAPPAAGGRAAALRA